jgi:hypothetical protein
LVAPKAKPEGRMTQPHRLSKINIRQFAEEMAASTTSNGRPLDPDALAERVWKETRRCCLCNKPSYVFAMFFPAKDSDPVMRTGLRPGQERLFAYGLCVRCRGLKDATERVERKIADTRLQEANIRAEVDAGGVRYTNETMPDGTRWITLSASPDGPKDAA